LNDKNYKGKGAYDSAIANAYERDRINEPMWQWEQDFVGEYVSKLKDGSSILDLPCGTGRFIPYYCGINAHICAADISEDMLQLAGKKAEDLDCKVKLSQEDAEKLNFTDASFDYLISWRFFHLLPFKVIERIVPEFSRVVRKEALIEVIGVKTGIWDHLWWLFLPLRAIRVFFRYFANNVGLTQGYKTTHGGKQTSWLHIASYSHRNSRLVCCLEKNGFKVVQAITTRYQYEEGKYLKYPVIIYRVSKG
jgi:ubiquinone/menaquinone biosynthesis C-methylase UbiE